MARRFDVVEQGSALAVGTLLVLTGTLWFEERKSDPKTTPAPRAAPAEMAAAVIPPLAESVPEAIVPALAESVEPEIVVLTDVSDRGEAVELVRFDEAERDRMAAELGRWVTRHPRQLVGVIADLAERQSLPVPATFLLSIAWSETRGKILAVSPAGAAGLAQATPAAYLSEGFDGKLFVTNQYLIGTRAYIMKKPLGDALTIAEPLLKRNTPSDRAKAKRLLADAMALRQEGMEELEALRPVANGVFFAKIAEADAHNLATLRELEQLIARGAPRAQTRRFHDRVARDYTYLRNLQRGAWAGYEKELSGRRDQLLRAHFREDPAKIYMNRPYEAGEFLGRTLDARFSPTQMAEFLAAHLATKQAQARELGIPDDELDSWTAALYNGGMVNIKRMHAGLIGSLRETELYMKKVPDRMARLERARG